jgi:hypothetical protein
VSPRPLVFLSGLTVGDFLLWNWSLNGNHDVLALASGLTLPPLAVAFLWVMALNLARLIAFIARRPTARRRGRREARRAASRGRTARASTASAATATPQAAQAQGQAQAATTGAPSRKIAA